MKIQLNYLLCIALVTLFTACSDFGSSGTNSEPKIRFIDTVTAQYQLPDSIQIIRDTIIDSRDGRVYKTVTLGEQTWMAENLMHHWYDTVPDLHNIRYLFDQDTNNIHLGGFFPWYIAMDTDFEYSEKGYGIPGKPYQGICPENYHIPLPSEWETLFQTISDWFNLEASAENGWEGVAKILKDTNFTYFDESQRGVDLVGFKILETGYMSRNGSTLTLPLSTFWTSENGGDEANVIRFWTFDEKKFSIMDYSNNQVISEFSPKAFFFNVRCVKD